MYSGASGRPSCLRDVFGVLYHWERSIRAEGNLVHERVGEDDQVAHQFERALADWMGRRILGKSGGDHQIYIFWMEL